MDPTLSQLERIADEALALVEWAGAARSSARQVLALRSQDAAPFLIALAEVTLAERLANGPELRPVEIEASGALTPDHLRRVDSALRHAAEAGDVAGAAEALDRFLGVFAPLRAEALEVMADRERPPVEMGRADLVAFLEHLEEPVGPRPNLFRRLVEAGTIDAEQLNRYRWRVRFRDRDRHRLLVEWLAIRTNRRVFPGRVRGE